MSDALALLEREKKRGGGGTNAAARARAKANAPPFKAMTSNNHAQCVRFKAQFAVFVVVTHQFGVTRAQTLVS